MPRLTLLPSGRVLDVPDGARLFDVLRDAKVPLASSCDGDSICGKCKVEVVSGGEHLSEIPASEEKLLKKVRDEGHWRLACDARIHGDVTITTGYW